MSKKERKVIVTPLMRDTLGIRWIEGLDREEWDIPESEKAAEQLEEDRECNKKFGKWLSDQVLRAIERT